MPIKIEYERTLAANSLSRFSSDEKVKVLNPTGAEVPTNVIVFSKSCRLKILTIINPTKNPIAILKKITIVDNLK